jgi:hypothetical protein
VYERQQREQLMAKFDKLEADNLKQKEEYEGKIYGLEKNHIRLGLHCSLESRIFNTI